MGLEFELKFRTTPEVLKKIQLDYPGGETIQMQTVYYDTTDGSLSKKKFTLRKRQENEESVCTLKTPDAGQGRGEFEMRCEEIEKAIPELCKLSGEDIPAQNLVEVCGARFIRYAKSLSLLDGTVELALDEGVLSGGGKELPFCEVEAELKEGSREAVVAFAQNLTQTYGLQEEKLSKFQRALELAKEVSYGRF